MTQAAGHASTIASPGTRRPEAAANQSAGAVNRAAVAAAILLLLPLVSVGLLLAIQDRGFAAMPGTADPHGYASIVVLISTALIATVQTLVGLIGFALARAGQVAGMAITIVVALTTLLQGLVLVAGVTGTGPRIASFEIAIRSTGATIAVVSIWIIATTVRAMITTGGRAGYPGTKSVSE